jgi:tRNA(Ile)-lysidine synthase
VTSNLVARVHAFVRERTPALLTGRTLLAVSGGGDSTAMAALLCDTRLIDVRSAVVAHFDHRLRSQTAAARDRAAVASLCDRYGLDLVCGAWDAPRPGESAAREARFAFLTRAAMRVGAVTIATGHTADDQAETVLMRMMRGAGLQGLGGIREQSRRGGVVVVRPILCATRAETREYCRSRKLAFVDDETNFNTAILRNRIRLRLLPELERASPGARADLLRTAAEAATAAGVLEELAAPAIASESRAEITLSKDRLVAMPEAARPFALRLAVERLLGDARDLDRRHYAQLDRALTSRTGAQLQLGRGLTLHVERNVITLTRTAPPAASAAPFGHPIPFSGRIGDWSLDLRDADTSDATAMLPPDAIVRTRKPGDRIRTAGGTRKLQDIFVDCGVPQRFRDGIPVIAQGSAVLWTPFRASSCRDGRPYRITARRES